MVVSGAGLTTAWLMVPFLAAQQSQYADLVLRGGKVISVDGHDRIAERLQ
jgi:hypothetical protein